VFFGKKKPAQTGFKPVPNRFQTGFEPNRGSVQVTGSNRRFRTEPPQHCQTDKEVKIGGSARPAQLLTFCKPCTKECINDVHKEECGANGLPQQVKQSFIPCCNENIFRLSSKCTYMVYGSLSRCLNGRARMLQRMSGKHKKCHDKN
jgi:hypothetical protein